MSSVSSSSAGTRASSSTIHRARYRASQFWRGLNASVTLDEQALATQILPPQALERFNRLPVDAQRHSFNVLHSVHTMDVHDPDLDAAALLHDIGKLAAEDGGVRLNLWLRSPLVLMEAWTPSTLRHIANPNPNSGWRYTAYVHLEHPRIGAEWAAQDGCSEVTCWLIRHHQDEIDEIDRNNRINNSEFRRQLLTVLQAADNSS